MCFVCVQQAEQAERFRRGRRRKQQRPDTHTHLEHRAALVHEAALRAAMRKHLWGVRPAATRADDFDSC